MASASPAPGLKKAAGGDDGISETEAPVSTVSIDVDAAYDKRKQSSFSEKRVGSDAEKFAGEESFYVDFEENDPRNPLCFSLRKKWVITLIATFATVLASTTTGSYNMGFQSMIRDLNCTLFEATVGLSTYALGFGVVPLVSASFSEEFGRKPLYMASGFGFVLMFMMVALSTNIQTVIIARLIQGGCASTGATMVGGTIADIWSPKERGLPMSVFAVAAVGGTAFGPVFAGWIEMNDHFRWRWIQWFQMLVAGVYLVLLPFLFQETRSSIILTRMAKKLRKETGNPKFRARVEDERASLAVLIWISCTRPIYLMFTELLVSSFSLWVGFAWGVTFVLVESIAGVFTELHHFNIGQTGTVFMALVIGVGLGFCSNLYQEKLYQKGVASRGPEARLYCACVAGILMPAAMFIYAWTSFPNVPWIAPCIAVALFMWATFIIYLAVFTYLADCYGPYASSALAGQSLARNLAATAFPLFTNKMYHNLGYNWANTLFGFIGVIMIPIPFALFFCGPAIRLRSKFSRTVMEAVTSQS